MFRQLDDYILDKVFQPVTDLLCKHEINPYTVSKFLFDGCIISSIVFQFMLFEKQLFKHEYMNCTFSFLSIIFSIMFIFVFRFTLSEDEKRYNNEKYSVSLSRATNIFFRFLFLLSVVTLPVLDLRTISNVLGYLAFCLWATYPRPPEIKTVKASVYSNA
jgi:hypothetical protein